MSDGGVDYLEKCIAELEAESKALSVCLNALGTFAWDLICDLRKQNLALAERIAICSELLSKRAEN